MMSQPEPRLEIVLVNPDLLVVDFGAAATEAQIEGWPSAVETELLPAPHRAPALRSGFGAVYVFALSASYGVSVPAGPGAVLKVGRVGGRSGPRFTYQHYGVQARSTLARSLIKYRVMWPWLGITSLDEASVAEWMRRHLDRVHFYVPDDRAVVIESLEVYIRARVGSVFEGAA